MSRAHALFLVWLLPLGAQLPEQARIQRAREELDRELARIINKYPAGVEITFEGVDKPGYELIGASFTLDGKRLRSGAPGGAGGVTPLVAGTLPAGEHVVEAKLTIRSAGAGPFTYVKEYKYKVDGKVTLRAQPGMMMRIAMGVAVNEGALEPAQRLKFTAKMEAKQVASWDNLQLPELIPARQVAQANSPQAPVVVAKAEVPATPPEKRPEARVEAGGEAPGAAAAAGGEVPAASAKPAVPQASIPAPSPGSAATVAAPPSQAAAPAQAAVSGGEAGGAGMAGRCALGGGVLLLLLVGGLLLRQRGRRSGSK